MSRIMIRMGMGLLMIVAVGSFVQAGLVQGKAWLGQHLIDRAWHQVLEQGEPVQPWPGAVSHPVARLSMSRLDIDYLVLDGADTPVLAWAPGMETGPNGQHLIAAHRDTHFRFMRELERGDRLRLEHADGRHEAWEVQRLDIVDARQTMIDMGESGQRLLLVTCFPFDAVAAGGPLRLVASLYPVDSPMGEEAI